jgi:hypothetical protein
MGAQKNNLGVQGATTGHKEKVQGTTASLDTQGASVGAQGTSVEHKKLAGGRKKPERGTRSQSVWGTMNQCRT